MTPRTAAVLDQAEQPAVLNLAREDCQPSPLNPRKHFAPDKLQELADTMAPPVGIIEPLVVRRVQHHQFDYEIIAGERRWRAAAIAGLTHVPVIVKDLTDQQVLELMVIENEARADLDPLERASAYQQLLGFGVTMDDLAKRTGHTRRFIFEHIGLLNLIDQAKQLLTDGRIAVGHAVLLSRLTPEQQGIAINIEDEYRAPLFTRDIPLLTEDEGEAFEALQAHDPYLGMRVKSIEDLKRWIAEHCRFKPEAEENAELFPETVAAVEDAEKVISITRSHHVQPEAKDGGGRIYSVVSWKRADGREHSKPCDFGVTGVVVVGAGRGEAFKVCVNKDKCDVHWKAERKQKEQAKAGPTPAPRAQHDEGQAHYEERQRQEEAKRKEFAVAAPKFIEAAAAKVKTAKLSVLVDLVAAEFATQETSTAKKQLGAVKTAEDALRMFALSRVVGIVSNSWVSVRDFPAVAKALGVDHRKLLKGDEPAKPVKAAKKAKKR